MKIALWLLDLNSESKDGSAELWLWGIDDNGERVLVIDRSIIAYFYAVIDSGLNQATIAERVKKAAGKSIVKLEFLERKLFGRTVQTIKVYCTNPYELSKVAGTLRRIEGIKDCLEDDIRLSMRYLIDNNVDPCRWLEINVVEETNNGVRAGRVYRALSPPELLDRNDTPSLRVLNFSMICYSREGSPKPDRNPVVIISVITNEGFKTQFIAGDKLEDKNVLEKFASYVREFDPDLIVGYGVNKFVWSYLKDRCRRLNLNFEIDRARTEPHTSVYGHVGLTGIANIDLADFVDLFPEVKVQNLANLSEHLGVLEDKTTEVILENDFADYWDEKKNRNKLAMFSMHTTNQIRSVIQLLLDFAVQLSSLVSLPLDHVMTAAVGFRVEWFMIKHAQRIGELVPRRVGQIYRPYAGGIVLAPQSGLHENIVALDFKSMYPNIMITYNLSPDTYISPKDPEPKTGVIVSPEVKHKFRKDPPGFYKEILSFLLETRAEIRSKMKQASPEGVEYRVLDARQKAIKIITNAVYGYAGWVGARWFAKPVAEAASAWGRHMILKAVEIAEKSGFRVIYGDTDSLFVASDGLDTRDLEVAIEHELGLEVDQGEIYVRIFFTEAKKRYAGLKPDGTLDLVGLEVIRGDWAEVAKVVQEGVLKIILKEQLSRKATDYVIEFAEKLKRKELPLRDLILWKTLTKPIKRYEINAPHVEAAKMMEKKGWALSVGDKVGYLILCGEGRLYERVKPYMYASYDEVDIDYYISKQIVPAAARILEFFGVKEDDLLKMIEKGKGTKSLLDFIDD